MINTHIIAYSYLLTHAISSHIGQLDISLKPALEGERGRGSCFRLPDTSPSVGTWRLQPKTTALLHFHQALVRHMLNHSKMESSLQLIIPAFSLVSKKFAIILQRPLCIFQVFRRDEFCRLAESEGGRPSCERLRKVSINIGYPHVSKHIWKE